VDMLLSTSMMEEQMLFLALAVTLCIAAD